MHLTGVENGRGGWHSSKTCTKKIKGSPFFWIVLVVCLLYLNCIWIPLSRNEHLIYNLHCKVLGNITSKAWKASSYSYNVLIITNYGTRITHHFGGTGTGQSLGLGIHHPGMDSTIWRGKQVKTEPWNDARIHIEPVSVTEGQRLYAWLNKSFLDVCQNQGISESGPLDIGG